jgi:hypothetical protein
MSPLHTCLQHDIRTPRESSDRLGFLKGPPERLLFQQMDAVSCGSQRDGVMKVMRHRHDRGVNEPRLQEFRKLFETRDIRPDAARCLAKPSVVGIAQRNYLDT